MNEEFWLQATLQALLAVEGDDWRQRTADIVEGARRLYIDRAISVDAYEAVETVYLGRLDRTASSKAKHEARETSLPGLSKTIEKRMRVVEEPTNAGRSKSGKRYSVLERLDRYRQCLRYRWHRYHAARTWLPADISDAFGPAEAAALRFVLLDAYEFGTCTRGLKHIAKAASCSRRTVQTAIRLAAALALLAVAETPGKTHVITVVNARASEWAKNAAAYGQAHHPFGREKNQQEEREEGSPHTLASACATPSDRCDSEPVETAQEPPAMMGAELRSRPPAAFGTNPTAIPTHGGISTDKWAEWAAIVPRPT